jgi:Gpi18-like mannosyltransferase
MSMPAPILVGVVAFAAGILLRVPGLPYETADAVEYLKPWYAFALARGWGGLGEAFTNYTPFYSYLLVAAAKLDGLAAPLTLVKGISFVFELGNALLAAAIASRLGARPQRAVIAFALVWLAPSVIQNGSFWGQADAIWTFFLLLALLALLSQQPGSAALAFGAAASVKAQALFLAPLGLALILNRTVRPLWLLAVPGIYLALALPTLLLGRPLPEVAAIYFGQSTNFTSLSMNAANPYVFVAPEFYPFGVVIGLGLAAVAGLVFAARVARAPAPLAPDTLLLAAAFSFMLMPFLLPKMHERFFYAFEIVVLVLAVARPAMAGVALAAQLTAFLSYLPNYDLSTAGLPLATIVNLCILGFLGLRLERALAGRPDAFAPADGFRRLSIYVLGAYVLQIALIQAVSGAIDPGKVWPSAFTDPRGLLIYVSMVAAFVALGRRFGPASSAARV